MTMQRDFLLLVTLVTLASPAFGQTTGGVVPAKSTSVPDFSGVWRHGSLPWFIPPASGPGPVTNMSRRADSGTSNYSELVGDYTNPILQPWAADVVKNKGDLSRAGVTYPNPGNQCWPEPVPFIYKNFGLQILQRPHEVTLLYEQNYEFRKVRLNDKHPAEVKPSWYGDSVGHYEGDTLVIDTVGVKTDRPYAMIDLFGTPYTKSLHVVERYRLREYDDVKDAIERNKKENWLLQGDVFSNHRGKFLQLHLTIEDEGVFTTPWTSTLTYVPRPDIASEAVCADNLRQYYYDHSDTNAPRADKPDF